MRTTRRTTRRTTGAAKRSNQMFATDRTNDSEAQTCVLTFAHRLRGLVDALHSMLESGAVDLHGGRIDLVLE